MRSPPLSFLLYSLFFSLYLPQPVVNTGSTTSSCFPCRNSCKLLLSLPLRNAFRSSPLSALFRRIALSSGWHAERKSFTFGVLLFDLITNLGSVVCPRNANIHLHDSSVKSCSLSGKRSRSLSKYSDSKLKLSMQTEYARLYQLKCTVRKIQGILKEFHN